MVAAYVGDGDPMTTVDPDLPAPAGDAAALAALPELEARLREQDAEIIKVTCLCNGAWLGAGCLSHNTPCAQRCGVGTRQIKNMILLLSEKVLDGPGPSPSGGMPLPAPPSAAASPMVVAPAATRPMAGTGFGHPNSNGGAAQTPPSHGASRKRRRRAL